MPAFKRQAHRKSQAVPPALQPAKNFLASCISTQLFYPAQELIYQWLQDLLHLGLTNLPYKESASDCSKSIPQSVNTRSKKSMGGKKKSLHTQSSVTSSQALTLSAPEASLPWQPWHLQPSWQESREGDTCLQFVSWVIGPAVQGHSSPRWQQAMAVCLDTRATLSLEWISGIY